MVSEMGFGAPDDVCNTGLRLGLGGNEKQEICSKSDDHLQQKTEKKVSLKYDHFFPSLSLGPPENTFQLAKKIDVELRPQGSSLSAVSSFSNSGCIKKEREFGGGEEVEVEKVSSRVGDEDENQGSPRKKLRLTKEQSAVLEESFKEYNALNPKQKQALAEQLNLRSRQVEVWFQNRRARTKLKQTEVDCELLKKCCETLTEENRKLQKEIQELKKSMKLAAAPLYMHLRAATLTRCPSCERICSGTDGSSTSAFTSTVRPKPHFYHPFTHPSEAF